MRPARETVTPVGIGPSKVATTSIDPAGRADGRSAARAAAIGVGPARPVAQASHAR